MTFDAPSPVTARLLACGVIAGPVFVIVFLLAGATRPGYDPMRHPVSSLAIGELGWTQTLNFIVAGLLTLAFAVGLRRATGLLWGPMLIGIWGAGLVGAGIWTGEPVSGYPPGTPTLLPEYATTAGAIHDMVSVPGFLALFAAFVVFAVRFARRRRTGWAVYSAATAIAFAVGVELANVGFGQAESLVGLAGLFQRLAVAIGWAWITLLAADLLRVTRTPAPAVTSTA